MKWGPNNANAWIFTFKEGLLSPVAHNLKLAVEEFEIELDGTIEQPSVARGTFRADSLRVVSAIQSDREVDVLSDKDKRKIEKTIRTDILSASKHPTIEFETNGELGVGKPLSGTLSLVGKPQRIGLKVEQTKGLTISGTLDQRLWGIKPFSAMMGTLKVSPEVKVVIELSL